MATYYGTDCDQPIVDFECTDCIDNPELSRVRNIALVHSSYYSTLAANPSNTTVWTTGITSGKIKLVPFLRGEFDGGSPKYGPGYGSRVNTYLGSEYKGKIYDPNYIDNASSYQSILKTFNWHVAFSTKTQTHLSKVPVTFAPTNPVADDLEKQMEWVTEFTFFQADLVTPFTTPASIFDCSYTGH